MRMHNPPHPGLVLKEYLNGITVSAAAKHLGITRTALSRILNEKTGISPTMTIKLEKAFGTTSAETWLIMQVKYNLWEGKAPYSHQKKKQKNSTLNLFTTIINDILCISISNLRRIKMEAIIGKWGNGAALRIPKSFMNQMKLSVGDNVQFRINNEQLIISKAGPTLDELLKKCNDSNRHEECIYDIYGQETL